MENSPEVLKDVEEKIKELKEKLEKTIREHPLPSIAVALSVGYIIARLLRRNQRS